MYSRDAENMFYLALFTLTMSYVFGVHG